MINGTAAGPSTIELQIIPLAEKSADSALKSFESPRLEANN